MRSTNDFGPFPSKIGRYIGSAANSPDEGTPTCDQAISTIDNEAIKENANTRMGRYASGARRFFKRKSRVIYAATANFPAAAILCTIL